MVQPHSENRPVSSSPSSPSSPSRYTRASKSPSNSSLRGVSTLSQPSKSSLHSIPKKRRTRGLSSSQLISRTVLGSISSRINTLLGRASSSSTSPESPPGSPCGSPGVESQTDAGLSPRSLTFHQNSAILISEEDESCTEFGEAHAASSSNARQSEDTKGKGKEKARRTLNNYSKNVLGILLRFATRDPAVLRLLRSAIHQQPSPRAQVTEDDSEQESLPQSPPQSYLPWEPHHTFETPPQNTLVVYTSHTINPDPRWRSQDDPEFLALRHASSVSRLLNLCSSDAIAPNIQEIRIIGQHDAAPSDQSTLIVSAVFAHLRNFPAVSKLVCQSITIDMSAIVAIVSLQHVTRASMTTASPFRGFEAQGMSGPMDDSPEGLVLSQRLWECISLENCTTLFGHHAINTPITTQALVFRSVWNVNDDPTPWLTAVDWRCLRVLRLESRFVSDRFLPDLGFSRKLVGLKELTIMYLPGLEELWGIMISRLKRVVRLQILSSGNDEEWAAVSIPPIPFGQLSQLRDFDGPVSCVSSYCVNKALLNVSIYGQGFDRGCHSPELVWAIQVLGRASSLNQALRGLPGLRELAFRVKFPAANVIHHVQDRLPTLEVLRVTITDEANPGKPVQDEKLYDTFFQIKVGANVRQFEVDFRLWWTLDDQDFADFGGYVIKDLIKENAKLSKIVFSSRSLFAYKQVEYEPKEVIPSEEEQRLSWTRDSGEIVFSVGETSQVL